MTQFHDDASLVGLTPATFGAERVRGPLGKTHIIMF